MPGDLFSCDVDDKLSHRHNVWVKLLERKNENENKKKANEQVQMFWKIFEIRPIWGIYISVGY